MRVIACFLLIFISFQAADAESVPGKKYFDMPVKKWLGLPKDEKFDGARELLSLSNREVSREQIESVVACMNAIGKSPVWESSTVGTLLTKCSFDMGVAKSPSEADWDALVACVKKEAPDFSRDELFAIGFSATGAVLAKDSGSNLILTPRTKRILEIMDRCEKK